MPLTRLFFYQNSDIIFMPLFTAVQLNVMYLCVCVVWMLQAPNWLRFHVCEWNYMDIWRRGSLQHWLQQLEQWSTAALLFLQLLQGWSAWQSEKELEKSVSNQHHCINNPSDCLRGWLCSLQKQSAYG